MRLNELDRYVEKGFARPVGFGIRPALIVIDFINGFTDSNSPLGADVSAEIGHTNRLISAARLKSIPICFSGICYTDPQCADAGIWSTKITGLSLLKSGSAATEQDSRLLRHDADRVITKKFASCFFGTGLYDLLLRDGIDTLLLAGCTTSGCVRATAVDACQYGIRPIIAKEAVADRSEAAHLQSLIDIEAKYGDVRSVDDIIRAIASIQPPDGAPH
jgi:nicotinamidase-related amidase